MRYVKPWEKYGIRLMYKVGDRLIHTRHGTDHSYTDTYHIVQVNHNHLVLARRIVWGERAIIDRDVLDLDLESKWPQFKIVSDNVPYELDKELFEV